MNVSSTEFRAMLAWAGPLAKATTSPEKPDHREGGKQGATRDAGSPPEVGKGRIGGDSKDGAPPSSEGAGGWEGGLGDGLKGATPSSSGPRRGGEVRGAGPKVEGSPPKVGGQKGGAVQDLNLHKFGANDSTAMLSARNGFVATFAFRFQVPGTLPKGYSLATMRSNPAKDGAMLVYRRGEAVARIFLMASPGPDTKFSRMMLGDLSAMVARKRGLLVAIEHGHFEQQALEKLAGECLPD